MHRKIESRLFILERKIKWENVLLEISLDRILNGLQLIIFLISFNVFNSVKHVSISLSSLFSRIHYRWNKTSQWSHKYIHMKKYLNGKRAIRNETSCICMKECRTLLPSSIPLYERETLRVRQRSTKYPRVSWPDAMTHSKIQRSK